MEDYMQHMKAWRSQMNDAEDQAAQISAEEQWLINSIQTLTKDIDFAKSETRRVKEEAEIKLKAKADMCGQILEIQREIALLENASSSLSQALELHKQEKVNLSTKLVEKRTFYGKTEEDIIAKLKERQDWLNSYKHSSNIGYPGLVNAKIDQRANESAGKHDAKSPVMSGNLDDACENMMTKLDGAKAKVDMLQQKKSEVASEYHKVKQSLEKLKGRMENFKPELRDMPIEVLQEENQAFVSDKSGYIEYQQSMQNQIDTIKGISHMIKCGCGEEYKVEVDPQSENF